MEREANGLRAGSTSMPLIPPGSTIGILGGGQLGRMLAIAAAELGYHAHIYCPEKDAPAGEVAKFTTIAAYEDLSTLEVFARSVDVVTYEFENIPHAPVEHLAKFIPVRPDPAVLAICQHRVLEKQTVNKLSIPTAAFRPVSSLEDLKEAAAVLGLPAILKTARMGYDGKGQWKVMSHEPQVMSRVIAESGLSAHDRQSRTHGAPFILESFVPFRMEISLIAARDAKGTIICYDAVQNIHKHHILSETIAPAPIAPALARKAKAMTEAIAEGIGLVGLVAVEMFVTDKDEILVNELAPRPHNSGHWTIDACANSQFEQIIRAICGLPLGSTERLCDARMLNLIGDDINDWQKYLAMPNARLHVYGKKEARPGRKMGHVTFLGD
ncbi:MAG: 5-(carboxyamino)imidazole ribonucleotide synthase [Pseudomonadota bacterium]|nr:5-(carboxyamino)imidazole ribonucleotide synthase [Pseudomonadota bacterium]